MGLVPSFSNVGYWGSAEGDWRLWDFGRSGTDHKLCEASGFGNCRVVYEGQVCDSGITGAKDVRNDFNCLVEVIVDEEGVYEHKDRFRNLQVVVELSCSLGFEMLNSIVCDVANGTAGEDGNFRDFHILVEG